MAFSHRLATSEDLPSIVEIYNSAIPSKAATCDLEPITIASREEWLETSDPQRRPIWVGYETDAPHAVTGYLSFEPFLNGRQGYDVTADLAVYLHPDHRGRGQGTYLLREAIAHAPKLGIRNIATTIFASNESSIRLFLSHGFEVWGRLPRVADLDGVIQDVIFVGRPVGE